MILLLLLSMVVTSLVMIHYTKDSISYPLIYIGAPFPFMLCYYALGGYLKKTSFSFNIKKILSVTVICFILAYLEHIYLIDKYQYFSALRPINRVFCFVVIILLFTDTIRRFFEKYSDNIWIRSITYIGQISFGIYLTHILCIQIFRMILPELNQFWFVQWAAVLVVDALAISMIKKAKPMKVLPLLGFS